MGLGSSPPAARRTSKEWGECCHDSSSTPLIDVADASKVPPSQFQKRKGSIYATPNSRDSHHGSGNDRDKAYFDKLKEKVGYPSRQWRLY